MSATDARGSALDQLTAFGLEAESLITTGQVVRVRHREDRAGSKNGWYVAHELTTTGGELVVVGAYGWWKAGDEAHKFRIARAGLSREERRAIDARAKDLEARQRAARAELAREAAARAKKIWAALPVEGPSPYLARKRVAAVGLRFARGTVVVPLRTGAGDAALVGLQWIEPDGRKRFLTGTAKQGAWHALGDPPAPGAYLAVCEGYATAASVHMATGWAAAVAFDAGNLLPVARALAREFPGARLVLCADDDRATAGNPGLTKARAACAAVRGLLAVPSFPPDLQDATDWNDLHVALGLEAVRERLLAAVAAPPLEPLPAPGNVVQGDFPGMDWRGQLMRTETGSLKQCSYNARLILDHDPAWTGVLGWCDFSHRVMKRQVPPLLHACAGEWEDGDDAELRFWLAARYGIEPRGQDLADAVLGTARARSFHPVREYLDGLVWDGLSRLPWWLSTYLGAGEGEEVPADERALDIRRYLDLVGRMYLIQAVSRIRNPGLKADAVLILEGPQGRGKSTALRILFSDAWFSDTPIDIGSKDAYEAIQGLWGFEMAELESLSKVDATRAKAFFSSPKDRFRVPYGHRTQTFTRQCVMAGTTNKFSHLRDETGNRRFWSVTVGEIATERLAADRDQLWAEADHCYRQGERWWPDAEDLPLFVEQQDVRLDADVWETVIAAYLRERVKAVDPRARISHMVTAAEIMSEALRIDVGAFKRPEQVRVGIVMRALGWRDCKPRVGGRREKGYRPSSAYLDALFGDSDVPF